MRDIVLTLMVLISLPLAVKRPYIGVLMWTWISLMSPHRYTWGFAYNMPFAQWTAIATFVGLLVSKDQKKFPFTSTTVLLAMFVLWMNVTTFFSIRPELAWGMWDKVMKIQLMVFVTLWVLHTREHIQWFVAIMAASLGLLAVKGGIHTLLTGGSFKVYGPAGSFIEENNSMALATIMIVPLLRYFQLQIGNKWVKRGLAAAMALCLVSALGSHSRGGLLAMGAMVLTLWWMSRKKFGLGIFLALLIPWAISFMPENWSHRMGTIENYEEDGSAMGRINAWTMNFNMAVDRPIVGGGFENTGTLVFALYAPNPTDIHSPHSIYFQALGDHGFVGLALFLLIWISTWFSAGWIISRAKTRQEWTWARDLANMIRVSLVGYAVGGAFLNLTYYDLPYNLMIAVVLTRVWMQKQLAQEQSDSAPARSLVVSTPNSVVAPPAR